MLDASIPLAVNAPQPINLGALMSLRSSLSDIALKQAQTEQARQNSQDIQAQTAQRNRDLSDQNNISEALKDPDTAKKVYGGDLSPIDALGVQPKSREALATTVNALLEKHATLGKDKLAQEQEAHTTIGATLAALQQSAVGPDGEFDPVKANQLYTGALSSLKPQIDLLVQNGHLDPSKIPTAVGNKDDLQQIATRMGGLSSMTDAANEIAKTKAATSAETQKGAESQAAADLSNYKLTLMKGAGKGDPVTRAAAVKGMPIFAGRPQEAEDAASAGEQAYQAALTSMDPSSAADKAAAAVKDVADRLRAYSPGVEAGKIDEARKMIPVDASRAAAEANASEPIRARAQADAQAYLMQKVGGPLAGVLDPGERSKITSDYLKANDDYAQKHSDAERLKQFVEAAKSGNQSAAGLMSTVELRSIVNRVNSTELNAAGGGSIVRRISNGLDKAGSGVPSDDTLKDLLGVALLNEQTARTGFAQKIAGINAVTHAKLDTNPAIAPQASDQIPHVSTKVQYDALPSGATYTEDDGKKYKKP